MRNPFELSDSFGPEKILYLCDPATGLKAILVVDNVAAGPSIGGTRMAVDVGLEECARLARAMTLKNAAAGLRHGGGKSVIIADPKMPVQEKERLIRSFAYALRDVKDYIVGPDMGTNETCMAWVQDVIHRAVGLPREIGGIPLDEIGATGYGLNAAINVAKDYCQLNLHNARVVVQGFGSVGKHAARFLAEQGTRLVGVSDSAGSLINPNGIDVAELVKFKDQGHSVIEFDGGKPADHEAVIDVECEIWIPAARPDVIHVKNVNRLKTKIVAQGANIPVTMQAEKTLYDRGVLVLPDFIANAGGVICAAVEYSGGTEANALSVIRDKISANTKEVLELSKRSTITPRDAAIKMAEKRVLAAMEYRKTF